jgi:hypothetical protein
MVLKNIQQKTILVVHSKLNEERSPGIIEIR